jgi:hypothetical protein
LIRHILPKISPAPSFPKRGIPPFGKGREEGFRLQRPYNYGLISNRAGIGHNRYCCSPDLVDKVVIFPELIDTANAISPITKESIIKKTYSPVNLPQPLFAKEGDFLPFVSDPERSLTRRVKGGRRDLVSGVYTIMD